MTRRRVVFRADASHALGFGHVARICALIEETEARGFEAVALFGGESGELSRWAAARGIAAQIGAWRTEDLARAANDPAVAAVVVDGPHIARAARAELEAMSGRVHTIVVDDGGDLPLAVSTVVNHNFHAPDLAAGYRAAGRALLGRRYALLRRELRRHPRGACARGPRRGERLRVAITFGGSDPAGATARTLAMLPGASNARPLEVLVITGPGYRDAATLSPALERIVAAGHVVERYHAPDDPGALFASAHAAVCSAGGTLGELAYLGCPALAWAIVDDQTRPAASQHAAGLIAGGGAWWARDEQARRDELHAFLVDDGARLTFRERALATVDGDGPRRVIESVLAAD
ncbi:MAG: hypothetical protein ACTHU0_31715 [Kofleriaceae bacterium]